MFFQITGGIYPTKKLIITLLRAADASIFLSWEQHSTIFRACKCALFQSNLQTVHRWDNTATIKKSAYLKKRNEGKLLDFQLVMFSFFLLPKPGPYRWKSAAAGKKLIAETKITVGFTFCEHAPRQKNPCCCRSEDKEERPETIFVMFTKYRWTRLIESQHSLELYVAHTGLLQITSTPC